MNTDELIQRMRQARQDRIDAHREKQAQKAAEEARRQAEKEALHKRQWEIAKRGFAIAKEIMDAVAQEFGWTLARIQAASSPDDYLVAQYQMPVPEDAAPEAASEFLAYVEVDVTGENHLVEDQVWVPDVHFGFGSEGGYEFIPLTDEEMSSDILDDEASLRAKMAEAVLEAYTEYIEFIDFPVEEEAVAQ